MEEIRSGVDAFWRYRSAFRQHWETIWPSVRVMTAEQFAVHANEAQQQARLEQRKEQRDDRH